MEKKKRVTIKELAREAGVSVGAASTVLSGCTSTNVHVSEETRQRVLRVAEALHYVPNVTARAMQSRRSYLLGFFYSMRNHYLQAGILRGLREVCRNQGCDIIIYPAEDVEEERLNLTSAHAGTLDGVVTIPFIDGDVNLELYRRLHAAGTPVIQLLSQLDSRFPCLMRDYRRIGREAVLRLAALGHRRIGLMLFANYLDRRVGPNSWGLHQGALDARQECGAEVILYPLSTSHLRVDMIRGADAITARLLGEDPRPTALVTVSSNLAYGAFACLTRAGLSVPGDISLIACGDDTEPFWQLAPNLTIFPIPLEEFGRQSAEFCLGRRKAEELNTRIYLPMREGDTICPPAKA